VHRPGAGAAPGCKFGTLMFCQHAAQEARMNRTDWMEDFQKNLSELMAKTPAADIERNVKAMMAQTFSRLDLVTREEFDIQAQLLERALARVQALEARLDEIEKRGN
jgi:BMFP domain-containing protein YqiC